MKIKHGLFVLKLTIRWSNKSYFLRRHVIHLSAVLQLASYMPLIPQGTRAPAITLEVEWTIENCVFVLSMTLGIRTVHNRTRLVVLSSLNCRLTWMKQPSKSQLAQKYNQKVINVSLFVDGCCFRGEWLSSIIFRCREEYSKQLKPGINTWRLIAFFSCRDGADRFWDETKQKQPIKISKDMS